MIFYGAGINVAATMVTTISIKNGKRLGRSCWECWWWWSRKNEKNDDVDDDDQENEEMVMRKITMMMIRKMRQASVTGQGGDGGTTPLAHLEGNHRSLHIISIFFLTSNYFWSVFYHYNSLNLGDHLKSMSLQIFIEVFRSQTLLPFKESVYTKCCTHTCRKDKLTSTLGWAHWPHWAPWAVC